MKILGIDPGLGRTGYALLEQNDNNITLKEVGCVTTRIGEVEYKRLLEIKVDLDGLITRLKADAVCVESVFFAANAKTPMSVGQARGGILVTIAGEKLKMTEVYAFELYILATGD